MAFKHIAVIGPGLIGGSVALAAREKLPGSEVRLWARRPEAVDEIAELRLGISATTHLEDAVTEADLVVLATPVGSMPGLGERLKQLSLDPGLLAPGCVVTDVGSVKARVMREMIEALNGSGLFFVGSHPMAGSEKQGIAHASAGLFEGREVIVTPQAADASSDVERVEDFWKSLGATCTRMTPEAHDALVARISHVPHLVAAVLAAASLDAEGDGDGLAGKFAAGGLRDTTRVASGSPEMWTEILLSNRAAVVDSLRAVGGKLGEVLAFLENVDEEKLRRFLAEAKDRRDML